jgi:hypothetical protein
MARFGIFFIIIIMLNLSMFFFYVQNEMSCTKRIIVLPSSLVRELYLTR